MPAVIVIWKVIDIRLTNPEGVKFNIKGNHPLNYCMQVTLLLYTMWLVLECGA